MDGILSKEIIGLPPGTESLVLIEGWGFNAMPALQSLLHQQAQQGHPLLGCRMSFFELEMKPLIFQSM